MADFAGIGSSQGNRSERNIFRRTPHSNRQQFQLFTGAIIGKCQPDRGAAPDLDTLCVIGRRAAGVEDVIAEEIITSKISSGDEIFLDLDDNSTELVVTIKKAENPAS